MSKIIVVYHSGYGHTQRMAQAVADGAGAELVAIDAEGNLPEGNTCTRSPRNTAASGSAWACRHPARRRPPAPT